ncbi:MAG: NAD(P)H-hydrate dehydratase, partial [bacterium]
RDIPDFATDLGDEAVVVDALLGVGIAPGGLKEPLRTLITALDACHAEVVAIDVPSGTGEDNGQVTDPALHATLTLTIGYPKVGLYLEPATFYAGRIEVIPLDYPGALTDDMAALSILDPIEVGRLLVPRVPSSHKGTYGRLLIIGGSRGMPGSVGLAAEAAFRAGVGAVVVATAASAQPIVAGFLREAMTVALPETPEGVISPEAMRTLLPHLEWATAIALGPGLTTHPAAAAFTGALLDHWPGPLVLDADGLKIAGKRLKLLGERTLPAVCTPHLGEASALLGRAREEIQSRRLDVALESSRDYNLVLLLKGYRTVIASPEGRASISVVGNPGMATAGTGDVLTGIIGGLLAQGVAPYDAARAGAYLHGSAGDGAAAEVGEISLMAGDLIRFLPRAVQAAMGSEV